jgi:hypothetical protein
MPDLYTRPMPRRFLVCAALLGSLALSSSAFAQQMNPNLPPQPVPQGAPPPSTNPICPRLEAQLASIEHGANDPARQDQIHRYQDAATQQQAQLDQLTAQARHMGCDSSGFFSLFSARSAQCGPVNDKIQQMRANLDQITGNLERLRSSGMGADLDNQRRSVLTALGQNSCGPQYTQYAHATTGPGNFFSNLFGGGGGNNNNPGSPLPPPGADMGPQGGGTYRTICVRTCDGGYFPVSFATSPARFADDEKTCKALCPATEAALYAYRNPGEDMNQAVSTSGQPYTALPTAFKFRAAFDPACSCKAAGQTWSDALKAVDDKAQLEQQGDIIVTEESAKKMQQQKMQPAKGTQPPAAKKGATPPATTAGTPAAPAATTPSPAADSKDKQIRSVGPTFIPNNNTTTR